LAGFSSCLAGFFSFLPFAAPSAFSSVVCDKFFARGWV